MNIKNFFSKRSFSYFFILGLISILIFIFIYFSIPIYFFDFNKNKEVVITYADNISAAHQIVVDKFNEEYKGKIRVETINLPFSKFSTNERKELLTRSLRSKSAKLDVFAIDLIWSARFAKWAEPLEKYIHENEVKKLLPKALESCLISDTLIALPMYLDISILYYRRDLIQALENGKIIEEKLKNSITWDDFFTLSKQFKNEKNPFYLFPADNYEGLVCSFIEVLLNQNPEFFHSDTLNWQSEEISKSFSLLNKIINEKNLTPQIVTDYRETQCYDMFVYDDGIFLRGWSSFPKDSKALLESIQKGNLIEQAALPHIKGSNPMSTIGGWNIMLSKYSEHKQEAFEFIKYIVREESQKIYYNEGAFMPVISSIYKDEQFCKEHPNLLKTKVFLDHGIHRPFLDNYTKISDVISYYANKVLKNQLTVEKAVNNTYQSLISGELILR
ncbi:MAG: extracellular solute-binding protein [Ignavibacteriae bacterium]|nr:extracellular solute-binding protein [Ignavibacteriota bacterium]MCB9259951.1 extracellular solute-binding protein [Ignavibacteriales bacterium]